MFLIELAMTNLIDDGFNVENVLRLLGILDEAECLLQESMGYLVAGKLGDLEIRKDHPQALEQEYNRWAQRLADIMGCPMYPYSQRSQEAAGVMFGNLKVQH